MIKITSIITLLYVFLTIEINAQTYDIDAVNTLTTNTCSGTFYDSGGAAAGNGNNYAINEDFTTTFCSATGQCINFNFTAFRTAAAGDNLRVYDGPTTASPLIGTYSGNLGAGVGNITSTGTCLTFRFVSDGAGNQSGWTAAISCITKQCPSSTSIAPAAIQNICVGSPTNVLTATITTAGTCGVPTYQYQWYSSLLNSNNIATATLLPGQTLVTLTPQNTVVNTLYYFCVGYAVNNNCAQTNATQLLASNVVQVNILALPSASAAGPDQSICLASTATLAANIPVTGVGAWSVVAGPSLLSTQFNNTALNAAVFTPAGGVGAYTLRWTISDGTCSTTDDVVINVVTVTAAAAGPDLTPCSNNVNLAGNAPANGTGTWTCITNCGGITFSNANSPTSTVNGLLNGVATTLRWTIANAPCASSSDNVVVTATVGANPQYTLVGNATSVSPFNCVTLTPAVNGQIGCAWDQNSTLAFASNFTYDFTINLGNNDGGADGIAFVMQNDPLGRCKCGLAGDQLGAGGITNSLIVEVDTYLNTDDRDDAIPTVLCAGGPDPDHMDLWLNGNVNPEIGNGCPSGVGERILPAAIPLLNGGVNYNIENGLNHILRIAWNAGTTTLTATVLNSAGLITYGTFNYVFNPLTVFGTNTPYFGFTASTGGLNNTQSFCNPPALLPVEMSAFNMDCEIDVVRFNWETISEHNNDYFQMEISTDGINYLPSVIINGAGNSTTKQQYSWEDENRGNETTYYRLSQFDFDGTQKILNTVASNCYDIKGIKILAMTNTDGNLVLNLENRLKDDYSIEIVDMTGKQVIQLNKKLESGINKILIDKSEISSGIYFVRVNNSIETVVKKVGLFN